MRRGLFCLLACAMSVGCGARTGLRLPDVPADVGVEEDTPVVDMPPLCMDGRFPLTHAQTSLVMLVDHSGSMSIDLLSSQEIPSSPTNRWNTLRRVLVQILPRFQDQLRFGLQTFSTDGLCDVFVGHPRLNIEPDFHTATLIFQELLSVGLPVGGTPTAPAIEGVRQRLQATAGRRDSLAMMLLTDGEPNCNSDLNITTCVCTRPVNAMCNDPENCLDDVRTVTVLEDAQRAGVPVYVAGFDDRNSPRLRPLLDRLAIAGGRPRTDSARRFYEISSEADLTMAFTAVQQQIIRCEWSSSAPIEETDRIDVNLAGLPAQRDTTHMNGWDISARDRGVITFFGPACDQANLPGAAPTIVVHCPDR